MASADSRQFGDGLVIGLAVEPLIELDVVLQQVVVVGNGRSYLAAIVTGEVRSNQVGAALESVNAQLPHYKCIRAVHIDSQPFTIENGLLTANGKLKRDLIAANYKDQIERMYQAKKN